MNKNNGKQNMKTNFLHIRISDKLKKEAELQAKIENRSLSNYIENLINKDLEKEKSSN